MSESELAKATVAASTEAAAGPFVESCMKLAAYNIYRPVKG